MMKGYLTQLLLSVSLAALVYSAPSAPNTASTARNKRSYHTDQAHRQSARFGKKPWRLENMLEKTKRNGLDSLDFDSILNDPSFLLDYDDLGHEESPQDIPFDNFLPVKDEMSNVIPGAQGPYDFTPVRKEQQHISDDLMEEFMMFLTMKEMGMLDACLWFRRR